VSPLFHVLAKFLLHVHEDTHHPHQVEIRSVDALGNFRATFSWFEGKLIHVVRLKRLHEIDRN